MWDSIAEGKAKFIGGVLQDIDGSNPETEITDITFDGTFFTVKGADYDCGIHRGFAALDPSKDWLTVYGPMGTGFRFQGPHKEKHTEGS